MNPQDDDSFMFGLTLTELIIILFFLLALLTVASLMQRDKKIDAQREELDRYYSELSTIDENLDEAFKKLQMMRDIQQYLEAYPETTLDEAFKSLRKGAALSERLLETKNELESYKVLLVESNKANLEQGARLIEAERQLSRSNLAASDAKGQVSILQSQIRKIGKGGADIPPCWPNPVTHKPEYLYNVKILLDNKMEVTQAWPTHRLQDVEEIPGVMGLANKTVDQAYFAKYARQISKWGKHKDVACVYYVRISNVPSLDTTTFKQNLLFIENYFYKWLDPK